MTDSGERALYKSILRSYRFVKTDKIAIFGPSGEAPPKLLLLGGLSAGQAFADRLAHSENWILDETHMLYTKSAQVVYRSAVFKKSKIAAAKAAHRSKVRWGVRPICICSALAKSERSQVGVNAYAKPNPPPVRSYRSQRTLATS